MKEAILMILFNSPDEYVYYEISDPQEFWSVFEHLDDWYQAEDYLEYVKDGLTLPSYVFDGEATKLHVIVVDD